MLLHVVSDLHLETHPDYGSYKHRLTDATYLALLGDIGHVRHTDFEKLIRKLLDHYELVFYLLGNHDPKGLSMSQAKQRLRALELNMGRITIERTIGRFVFLDRSRYDLDQNITFLGCQLYSHVPSSSAALVESSMIEFRDTVNWSLVQHNTAHDEDVAWLNSQVEAIEQDEPGRSIVILSHHCPTVDERASDPKHRGSRMKSAFATDLSSEECWNSPCVTLWAWGHTHWNCNFKVDRKHGSPPIQCFANQKGYYQFPKASFDPSAILELPLGRLQSSPTVANDGNDSEPGYKQKHGSRAKPRFGLISRLFSRKPL